MSTNLSPIGNKQGCKESKNYTGKDINMVMRFIFFFNDLLHVMRVTLKALLHGSSMFPLHCC